MIRFYLFPKDTHDIQFDHLQISMNALKALTVVFRYAQTQMVATTAPVRLAIT